MTRSVRRREWIPSACTLPTREQPPRVAEFDALFASSLRAVVTVDATTIELVLDGSAEVAAAARDLTRREAACCSFFTFAVAHAAGGVVTVLVGVDAAHGDVLAAMAARAQALTEPAASAP